MVADLILIIIKFDGSCMLLEIGCRCGTQLVENPAKCCFADDHGIDRGMASYIIQQNRWDLNFNLNKSKLVSNHFKTQSGLEVRTKTKRKTQKRDNKEKCNPHTQHQSSNKTTTLRHPALTFEPTKIYNHIKVFNKKIMYIMSPTF